MDDRQRDTKATVDGIRRVRMTLDSQLDELERQVRQRALQAEADARARAAAKRKGRG